MALTSIALEVWFVFRADRFITNTPSENILKSFFSIFHCFSELWFVVAWCDHLCDAVWLSTVLFKAPQSHHPEGHEEKDYDWQLWLPWRWVEPDLWDGQGHCTQVSLVWLPPALNTACLSTPTSEWPDVQMCSFFICSWQGCWRWSQRRG